MTDRQKVVFKWMIEYANKTKVAIPQWMVVQQMKEQFAMSRYETERYLAQLKQGNYINKTDPRAGWRILRTNI